MWKENQKEVLKLKISEPCEEFRDYYDAMQSKISRLSIMDELLAGKLIFNRSCYSNLYTLIHTPIGMLSKAKGQVLRVAAVLHVLSCDSEDDEGNIFVSRVSDTISNEALLAAQDFVQTCCQHAAYVAGRGKIEDEIDCLTPTGTLLFYLHAK